MGNKGLQRLVILAEKNARSDWVNTDLYRLMFQTDLYIEGWQRLQRRRDAALSTETMEQLLSEVAAIIDGMRNEARMTTMEVDPRGRILHGAELVREVVGMILAAIYERPHPPIFRATAHGWRPQRGRHTALKALCSWREVRWLIVGRVTGQLTRAQQHAVVFWLRQRIGDERWLNLIWRLLGDWELRFDAAIRDAFSAPLLSGYFHPFDLAVEGVANRRPELLGQAGREAIEIRYVRCAGEWLVGVDGSPQDAIEVMEELQQVLQRDLALEASQLTVASYPARRHGVEFLGTRVRGVESTLRGPRFLRLEIPMDRLIAILSQRGFCRTDGQPTAKGGWTNRSTAEIIDRYNRILKTYLEYYTFADNYRQLRRVQYILQHSAARTLAQKLRLSVRRIFHDFGPNLTIRGAVENAAVGTAAVVRLELMESRGCTKTFHGALPHGEPDLDFGWLPTS